MARIATKMPNFCLNRIRPLIRVCSPPSQPSKCHENPGAVGGGEDKGPVGADDSASTDEKPIGRRIVIVVDSSVEAKTAVQWALSHAVQSQDTVVLLHVMKPSKKGEQSMKKIPEFLISMKNSCKHKRPEVNVEVAVVEGREKGPAIVEAAKTKGAALLVLAQKKRSMTWRMLLMWAGNRAAAAGGMAEYCVQNAACMAVAVRRKSKKVGGYLITTKRQKDFWLLA